MPSALLSTAVLALVAQTALALPGCDGNSHGKDPRPLIPRDCPKTAIGCTNSTSTGLPYSGCCVPDQGLLVFAQNWTMGYCQSGATCANETLNSLPKNEFTIHGLWPDYCDGTYNTSPLGCDPARAYHDVSERIAANTVEKGFVEKLKKVWKGADGSYEWMWSHEWTKHGTCMSTINPTCFSKEVQAANSSADVLTYFHTTYKLRERYEMGKILRKKNIVPSATKPYKFADFQAAIEADTGYPGTLQCVKVNGTAYLSEVWLFLNARPNLKFVSQIPVKLYNSCPNNTDIWFLPQPKKH
ncbi:ribonuclease T2-like protein [Fimicolochytrium jonesii]|uniref:ribonuclease T2-like protein n=1 Tax=Fimicolochytrium jonesii TaxID=1396493 RepID=UPI0022FF4173|nr:ribonuclease T2-like protein [Fimicolochytrium jonesii]KAI8817581.1 ribonuclease T2-like protein [Fimicolochytrium jonesii]